MSIENCKTVTILLVEDDDVDAMGIQRAFKKLRVANPLFRAKDGIEAIELLTNQKVKKPYIILLDLNMPRMGGIEFLETIRDDPKLTDSIVFVLTTSQGDEDKIKAYRNHVAGYVVKSEIDTNFADLFEMLEHYWRVIEFPIDN